ncbi:STAG domain-containing protein [Dipodascopsis tothii]|uniref:STAG domain-containing protein n=1 Tax=Dipodascopsis tothii TaxID=44089 RepID=UPI0034CD624B
MSSPNTSEQDTEDVSNKAITPPRELRKRKLSTVIAQELDDSDLESSDSSDSDASLDDYQASRSRPKIGSSARGNSVKQGSGLSTLKQAASRKSRQQNNTASLDESEFENGLFDAVRDSEVALDEVALNWIQDYEADSSSALQELVNFILKSCGCGTPITKYDIEDQDSATDTLAQIQAVQQNRMADYPLISKKTEYRGFRKQLISFIDVLIKKAADRGTIYDEPSLMENIEVWISAMSSSTLRSFRHTSTSISLSILSSICHLAAANNKGFTTTSKLLDNERSKPRKSKDKLKKLQENVTEYESKASVLEGLMRDIFDTIFVHRYRDIDPKIRTECVKELGKWMLILPSFFLDGQYLRYLGWLLSDSNNATRLEVIRSLLKLYEDKDFIGGLRQFTERFRSRILEIATNDVDHIARATAVSLLNAIRSNGFLEDDDIKSVCGLIFDKDARVRRSTAPFFIAHILETVEEHIEELGGDSDEIKDYLAEADLQPESGNVTKMWFTFKAIADMLVLLDSSSSMTITHSFDAWFGAKIDSRRVIAGASLWESCNDLPHWRQLAVYLLHDHSRHDNEEMRQNIRALYQATTLTGANESPLLDLLVGSIQASLTTADVAEKSKTKKKSAGAKEDQEKLASEALVSLLPDLLKKFDSSPESASSVLRLHNVVNLEVYQQLRQEQLYQELFGRICKVFASYDEPGVLRLSRLAISHAISFASLRDVIDPRLKELQDECCEGFRHATHRYDDISVANLDVTALKAISLSIQKLLHLTYVSDTTDAVEDQLHGEDSIIVNKLLKFLDRTAFPSQIEIDSLVGAIMILRYYVLWKFQNAIQTKSVASIQDCLDRISDIVEKLEVIILSDIDIDIRYKAVCSLIDLVVSLKVINKDDQMKARELIQITASISPTIQQAAIDMLVKMQDSYTKCVGLKPVIRNSDEETHDLNPASSSAGDHDIEGDADHISDDQLHIHKAQQNLKLCELTGKIVLGILSQTISETFKSDVLENAKSFGPTYEYITKELSVAT